MPVTVLGNVSSTGNRLLEPDKKFNYDYPKEIGNIAPDTDLHKMVMSKIINRASDSYIAMQKRHSAWREIDRTLTAYIPLSEKERVSKGIDPTRPTSIVFPISFENMETLRTYLSASLLSDPLHRYEGLGSVDADIKAALLELVVRAQVRRGKARLALMTFFRDAMAYGMAAMHLPYKIEKGFRTVRTPDVRTIAGVDIFGSQEGDLEEFTIFEGTKPDNIDPYKMLPDPDIPIHRANEGGSFGWVHRTSLENLLDMEFSNPSFFFNVRYVAHLSDATTRIINSVDGRADKYGGSTLREGFQNRPVDVVWMYFNLIPREWKLGRSEYPERWLFALAGDNIMICAHKMGLDHNRIPVITCAPDTDGHGLTPVSKMEVIYGLQNAADFFFNTRSLNVRKALNDMWVVDPNIINVASMKTTGPGKLIYLKRSQWGEGKIDAAIKNFPVADVTQNLSADVQFATQASKRATGAVDILQGGGSIGKGRERVSATEASGLLQGALSRMEFMAQVIDEQAMNDMGDQYAHNVRQFMDEELFVRLTGRNSQLLREEFGDTSQIRITPQDIDTYWEVMRNDGSIPGSGNAQIWQQIFQAVSSDTTGALQQRFDIGRIFDHLARIAGAKNLDQFKQKNLQNINPQVRANEDVLREVEKGNFVPVDGEV